jgi:hypothetical protein
MPQLLTESPTDITDGIVPLVFHRELEKNYGLVPQLPMESQTKITDSHHRRNSSVSILQRVGKKLRTCATITNGITDGITVEFYRQNIMSVNWWREFIFLAPLSVCMSVGNFVGIFVFFITDRNGDGIRITDAHDSDGFVSSEIPSVIILRMVCVPYTDGINPSVKLYNGAVCI